MSKRSFDEFAQHVSFPLPDINEKPYADAILTDDSDQEDGESEMQIDDDDKPIRDLTEAGHDLDKIKKSMFGLTNDISPIFALDNLCSCKHRDVRYCVRPHMVASLTPETEGSVNPSWKNPHENFIIRTILQLASRIMTHPHTTPFWYSLWNPNRAKSNESHVFYVSHLTRLDSDQENTIHSLAIAYIAKHIRFHFKEFTALELPERGHDPTAHGEECMCGVDKGDPDSIPDCPHPMVYAWENGGPTVDRVAFSHVFINTCGMEDFDLEGDGWLDRSISSIQWMVVQAAVTIVHELAHATVDNWILGREPYCNDESVLEPGFAAENFIFGGILARFGEAPVLEPWPNHTHTEGDLPIREQAPGHVGNAKLLPAAAHVLEKEDWVSLLRDDFWNEKYKRKGRLKKLWLRKPISNTVWNHYYSKKFRPDRPPRKKARLEKEGEDHKLHKRLSKKRARPEQEEEDEQLPERPPIKKARLQKGES